MALTINTNLYALNTQRNLRKSESPLASAMQRLSSGLRINSSKDDAAGLAIATRMTRQITGLSVAMRNANDGVSFAQTAEGAMDEMVTALQRVYELANQSASYNTSLDRSSMNTEVTELVSELNRIVSQTRYNGEQFLNKSTSIAIQVGIEVNETLTIATSNVSPTAYGVQSSRTNFDDTTTNLQSIASSVAGISWAKSNGMAAGTTLAGVSLGDQISSDTLVNNSNAMITRINQYTAQTNVTAFSFGNTYVSTANVGTVDTAAGGVNVLAGYFSINGIAIGSTTNTASTSVGLASAVITAINAKTSQTGVTAVFLGTADTGATTYGIALVNTNGAEIKVSVSTANSGTASAAAAYFGTAGGSIAAGQNGQIIYSAPLGESSKAVSSATAAAAFGISTSLTAIALNNSKSINDIGITTVGDSNIAILAVKQGLETINSEKAKLGAKLNRLESTIRNLDNVRENISAAKSRTMDADFAVETANLTKSQIMQQAGISMLAQANTLPQQVLSLLGR
ncbi:MAG: flagellin [Nitrospirota bacterium]